VNACLMKVCSAHLCAIVTVEGIGGFNQGLHPVQQRMEEFHGSQCGFCTPGIVMALYTILRSNPKSSPNEIEEKLDGNLCRCTGYRPILDAAKSLGSCDDNEDCDDGEEEKKDMLSGCNGRRNCCSMGESCCQNQKNNSETNPSIISSSTQDKMESSLPYSNLGWVEPIFPPELRSMIMEEEESNSTCLQLFHPKTKSTWFQPTTLEDLIQLKSDYQDAHIVGGGTKISIESHFEGFKFPVLISPSLEIEELQKIELDEFGTTIGGGVTLNSFQDFITPHIDNYKFY